MHGYLPRVGNVYHGTSNGGGGGGNGGSISYRGAQSALSFVESWNSYGFGIMAQALITVKHTHTQSPHSLASRQIEAALGCPGRGPCGVVHRGMSKYLLCVCVCAARADIC